MGRSSLRQTGGTPTFVERCVECGARKPLGGLQCVCGSLTFRAGAIRPTKLVTRTFPKLPEPWHTLQFRASGIGILYGMSGAGKSTLLGLLNADHWCSGEEALDLVKDRCHRLGRDVPNLIPCESVDDYRRELSQTIAITNPWLHILDSASAFGMHGALEAVMEARGFVRETGSRAICILQCNKDGEPEGLNEVLHAVDWVAEAAKDKKGGLRRLRWHKNRFGGLDTHYWKFNDQGQVATPKFSESLYSVEGSPGNYQLVKYPVRGTSWAGPWEYLRKLRKINLMSELRGTATAGVLAPWTDTGFEEPDDVEERRAFAISHGSGWLDLDFFPNQNLHPAVAQGLFNKD